MRWGQCHRTLLFGRDHAAAHTLNASLLEHPVQISDAGQKHVLPFICDTELFCSSSNNKSIFVNGTRCRKCYLPARTQRGNHPITLLLGFAVYLFVGKLRMWNWTPTARQLHTRTQSAVTNSRPSGLDAIVEANCNIKHKQCSCHFKEGRGG